MLNKNISSLLILTLMLSSTAAMADQGWQQGAQTILQDAQQVQQNQQNYQNQQQYQNQQNQQYWQNKNKQNQQYWWQNRNRQHPDNNGQDKKYSE